MDISTLSSTLYDRFPDILFAYLFGSAKDGDIREEGDIDLGIWLKDEDKKSSLIPDIIGTVEELIPGLSCDLVILNNAGSILSFEVLQGRILFVREEAKDLHAGFYSLTCREYEDAIAWMKKQLKYRGYEVQWSH